MINQSIWRQWVWRMPHVKKKTFELRQSSGFCVSQYGRVWEWRMLQEKNQLAVLMIFWGTLMIHRWIYGYPIFNLWFEQVDEGRAEGMVPTCPRLCCRPGVHLQNVFPNSNQTWLVVSTPLKNMKVSWDDYSKYTENHQPEVFWTFAGKSATVCNLTWLAIKALPFIPIYRLTR